MAVVALCAPALAHAAAPTVPPASIGFDISFPQCGRPYPASPGFGVVGVNRGHPFSTNPCLRGELRWVGHSAVAAPAFYANVDAPGPGGPHWPGRQNGPRACRGANSAPCAYDYGWDAARASFSAVLSGLLDRHTPLPRKTAQSARWWLDVEVANAWESQPWQYGATRHSHVMDQTSVLGSIAYLKRAGVAFVGIYSSVPMWRAIMGASQAGFASVPVWVPGSASLSEAERNCATTSFTGGFVAMTQYPSLGYDGDFQCGLGRVSVTASSSVAASAGFRDQLAVPDGDGPVTFAQTTGAPALAVSPAGAVTAAGPLARGTYRATGTTSDAAGDTGTFVVTLRVGILAQAPPTGAQVTASGSASFAAQLAVSGATGPVAFAQSSGLPGLLVSPTGVVSTGGPLAAGTYHASGTTSDSSGDSGTFRFALTVGLLSQQPPTSATLASANAGALSVQLVVSGSVGPVVFTQATGQPDLAVSSSGLVTASAVLAPGTYTATGVTRDATGDAGVFTFTLKVTPSPTTTTTSTTTTTTTTTTP